jgi:Poxvirus Late Transcription Factor VLTF3 like
MKKRLGELQGSANPNALQLKSTPTSKSQAALLYHTANTIDEKHTEMLQSFHRISHETIPQFKEDIKKWKNKAKQYAKERKIEEYLDALDKIELLKKQITEYAGKHKRYLLENSKYIFQYFEEKKIIAEGGGKQNLNALNSFFKIKGTTDEASNIHSNKYNQSRNLFHNYWKNVNNEILNVQDYMIPSGVCEKCYKGELIPQDEEGILICNNNKCAAFITHIVDNNKPANKEPPNEVSYTAYIRLNHFKEILSQFQAKETTQIPDEVIEAIRARIKKERITDTSQLTYDKMRDILRKLSLNKYFEHIQYINSIFGIKPPIMNEELHETLCVLFIEIQKPWALHCPANRTNFFNYTYTLYQLCVLLDQTQYLPYIILMKDVDKQREQDQIWKKVCQDLDWEFIPSV